MDAAHNTNLIDKNTTTKAPALVDEVIYICGDKVKDLIYDTVKEEESRTDEIIKTEKYKINDEKLYHWKYKNNIQTMNNMTTHHYNMIRMSVQKETERNQSNTNQDFQAKYMKKVRYIYKQRKWIR